MEATEYVALAERDSSVIGAIRSALVAMGLTHGARVTMSGVTGSLNYEREMLQLRAALELLGADPDESTEAASDG